MDGNLAMNSNFENMSEIDTAAAIDNYQNCLMADFLGMKYHSNGTISFYPAHFKLKMGESTLEDFEFTINWNWFMEIVAKINKLFEIDSIFDEKGFDRDIYRSMVQWVAEVQIDNAVEDAVTIIKWYNVNKAE